jgi:hypothetical protein
MKNKRQKAEFMNRIIILLMLTLFAWVDSSAQDADRVDVVVLKDGSFVKGQLVEYIVDSHLIIINLEGEVREFKADRINKVNSKLPKVVTPKKGGYINTTNLGILMSSQPWQGAQGTVSFHSINGWEFKKIGVFGIGTGVEFINQTMNIPVFLDAKIPLGKSNVVPYVGAFGGYSFSTHAENDPLYDLLYYSPRTYRGGMMWGAELGLINYTKTRFGITFSAGYQFHSMETTYDEGFWNGVEWKNHEVQEEIKVSRFRLSMGIVFR